MNAHAAHHIDFHAFVEEYSSLAQGVSVAGRICPKCFGGRSNEGSLSVTRSDYTLLYKCHRAACDFAGKASVVGGGGGQQTVGDGARKRISGQDRYAALGRGRIPEGIRAWLAQKYHLSEYHFAKGGLSWTKDHSTGPVAGRLVMPVVDEGMTLYGYTARKLDDQPGPKTLSFFENKRGAWYFNPSSLDVIIVEDQLSAIRASKYINAVALMGTDIPEAVLNTLRDKAGKIFLALDKDAYRKSLKITMKNAARIKLTPIKVPKDLKDMNEHELIECLTKYGIKTPL